MKLFSFSQSLLTMETETEQFVTRTKTNIPTLNKINAELLFSRISTDTSTPVRVIFKLYHRKNRRMNLYSCVFIWSRYIKLIQLLPYCVINNFCWLYCTSEVICIEPLLCNAPSHCITIEHNRILPIVFLLS